MEKCAKGLIQTEMLSVTKDLSDPGPASIRWKVGRSQDPRAKLSKIIIRVQNLQRPV